MLRTNLGDLGNKKSRLCGGMHLSGIIDH